MDQHLNRRRFGIGTAATALAAGAASAQEAVHRGSMATSGRGSGVVGYNVQFAVETDNHLIVTHEVTTSGSDRSQLQQPGDPAVP